MCVFTSDRFPLLQILMTFSCLTNVIYTNAVPVFTLPLSWYFIHHSSWWDFVLWPNTPCGSPSLENDWQERSWPLVTRCSKPRYHQGGPVCSPWSSTAWLSKRSYPRIALKQFHKSVFRVFSPTGGRIRTGNILPHPLALLWTRQFFLS